MTHQTYAESSGAAPFDWNAFLERAMRGEVEALSDDYFQALSMSGRWVTCACGSQCDVIPRWSDGSPRDSLLTDLGVRFYGAIRRASWAEARDTLAAIETRSAELIAQITGGAA